MDGTQATQTKQDFDLLVIPQTGHLIPGDHLTPTEAEQAKEDWRVFGTQTAITDATWQVHIAHILDGELRTTSMLLIPRTR